MVLISYLIGHRTIKMSKSNQSIHGVLIPTVKIFMGTRIVEFGFEFELDFQWTCDSCTFSCTRVRVRVGLRVGFQIYVRVALCSAKSS